MSEIKLVKIKKLDPKAVMPEYKTKGSSGFDLVSIEDVVIPAGKVKLVHTGISLEIESYVSNFEVQVRSRSGLALKNGVFVLNSPGTVDFDYRGEVGVILANFSDVEFRVSAGDRIAQAVVVKIEKVKFTEVEELSDTVRGEGGFGSTGK